MGKVRVPLHGKPQGFATLDTEATKGATVGVNLFWQNGAVVTEADFAAAAAEPGPVSRTLWELVLKVPANVLAVAGLASAGFVRRDGAGAWTASAIVNADLSGCTTSGLNEGSNLYYTDTRADARVDAGIAAHVAAADPHPQYLQAGEAEPPITAGTTTQYWRGDKAWRDFGTDVRATALTGLSTATATAIAATDTVLDGFGKAQAQINANVAALAGKASTGANTFSGNQTIQVSSGSPSLSIVSTGAGSSLCNLDSQAGTLALFAFKTNGLNRILFTKGSVAEAGSNVGSDAEIRAHTDAGAFNFRILTLKRDSGDLIPGRDNLQNFGGASNRLKEIFCGNATINTSDAREKTPLRPLTNAELAVARELSGMAGMFQWLASVEDKGGAARLHAGLIAQDVVATFAAHGLDANRYGFVCYDEWPETVEPAEYDDVLDADGEPTGERVLVKPEITRPAGNRYGIRYGELAMFLIAGQEQRLRALEAKA